ncbi:type I secretion system permease/ATPase [Methylobacter sp. YRD-M1]|uniref:type I secretion system permease/ATPase n=1 Tax=Methylobacter sp. YRD-M1 TaxID=2911520 RepID=UPI00227C95A4|nr:type I secretion system permease/ATPase [Methylobacter sp. YRD-M1]WAK00678.1 type I secretion system permease/ATPase [Methylobacter sp. YRD-M1]
MRELLLKCRAFVLYTGIFSFVINILLLTPIVFLINALDRVLSSRSLETLFMLAIMAVSALMIEAFLENVRTRLLSRFSLTLHRLLGVSTLKKILEIRQKDNQTRYAMEDVDTLQNFITTTGVKALFDLPWLPFYLIILYFFHPFLCLYAIIVVLILLALAYWEHRATRHNQMQVSAYSRGARNFLDLAFSNNEVVNALGMQDRIAKRWWLINEDYLDRKNRVENQIAMIQSITQFVRTNITIFSLSIGAYLVIHENLSPGIMIGANILMGRTIAPISSLISAGKSFIDAKAAYNRLDALLKDSAATNKALTLPTPLGNLSVERVFFFLNRDRNILNGVSFSLNAGECLAVIGSSASGKTTLARLLTGYYKPNDGFVRLDGADVSQWSKNGLGAMIGYLPQDVQLFSGTVAENIARLEPVKEHEHEIIHAAKRVGIHDMILKLPQGYDTDIGEKGNKLSGGQRQRLGLARAIFDDPKFLVLDEPNSNLDGEAELELLRLLNTLKRQGTTIVVVTHKPNLVEAADKILVLHEGNVIKFGPKIDVLSQKTGTLSQIELA